MTVTKSYPTSSTSIFIKIYNILSKLFKTKKNEVKTCPKYYDDEELELRRAQELVRKQIEKYRNQTFLYIH